MARLRSSEREIRAVPMQPCISDTGIREMRAGIEVPRPGMLADIAYIGSCLDPISHASEMDVDYGLTVLASDRAGQELRSIIEFLATRNGEIITPLSSASVEVVCDGHCSSSMFATRSFIDQADADRYDHVLPHSGHRLHDTLGVASGRVDGTMPFRHAVILLDTSWNAGSDFRCLSCNLHISERVDPRDVIASGRSPVSWSPRSMRHWAPSRLAVIYRAPSLLVPAPTAARRAAIRRAKSGDDGRSEPGAPTSGQRCRPALLPSGENRVPSRPAGMGARVARSAG